jgi:hypothetical protein
MHEKLMTYKEFLQKIDEENVAGTITLKDSRRK